MALFKVSNNRAQFDAAGNEATDQYGAGIRFTQGGNARVTTASPTNYNQGLPMSSTGQVAIVDATAGLPAGTIFHNGLPMSGDKVCVSRNATAVVSNGLPYDSAGAVAGDINFDLNFIGTNTLNPSITFTRASSATFVGSNGLIQSATTNTPRFDYDPVTLAAKGLLIEEQRTNLLTYSEQFDNVVWTKTSATVTANAGTAPDGTQTADLMYPSTSGLYRGVYQQAGVSAAIYTDSFYVKASGKSWVQVIGLNGSGNTGVWFNIVNGTVGTQKAGYAGAITPAGNGWYRVAVTHPSQANPFVTINVVDGDNVETVTASGTDGVLLWGAQLEAGSFATSYIPTVASQVTRSADVASVNTLSPWYNATEGTLYLEADVATLIQPTAYLAAFNDSTSNELIGFYQGNNAVGMIDIDNGSILVNITRTAIAINTPFKAAGAYKLDDFALTLNASAVATDTTATLPTVNTLNIGSRNGGGSPISGHIRRITYYPRRLSNAELQALTA